MPIPGIVAQPFEARRASLYRGLLAFFRYDEGAGGIAVSSRGGSCVWTGTVSSQWVTGKFGGGAGFNGTDYLLATNASFLDYDRFMARTVSFWAKIGAGGANQMLLNKWDNLNTNGWIVFYDSLGALYLEHINAAGTLRDYWAIGGGILGTGTWHHVVITYDGRQTTTSAALWLDGQQQTFVNGSLTLGTTSISNATRMQHGACIQAGAILYPLTNGSALDATGFWNRVLNPSEIAALYNNGNGIQL